MQKLRLLFIIILLTVSVPSLWSAEEADSASATQLCEIVVSGVRREPDVIPAQILRGEALRRLGGNSVADALRYCSGVQVKDYGGVGGIKTVNVRSMGTNHTGVVYDGVQLGNAQNGQIDLGQFSLDNIEMISVHNGQKSSILQPARDFGSAAAVYMRTRTPDFGDGGRYRLRFGLRTGSFDLFNPSVLGEFRLSERVSASAAAEWVRSSGKYRFRYRRLSATGEVAYDTTAVRQNGDIDAVRTELNVHGSLTGGEWHAKAYNYTSERGVPGAIVNNVWRRGERIWDNNTFAQASLRKAAGRWTTLANTKYAFYRTRYVNNDDKQLAVDNLYRQQEAYFSTANQVDIRPGLSVSVSYDLMWNTMDADMFGFVRPDRYTNMLAAAAALDLGRFKAQASALGTFIRDEQRGQSPTNRKAFTPALYLSGNPLGSRDFAVRAFVKRSFRMPTFNDLYYADMGNSSLEPERVTQYNLGLVYDHTAGGFLRAVRLGADLYYNRVKDKIVAYPKGQQFRWTMLNLGLVDIRGADVSALATLRPAAGLDITLRGQYTFQRAIDVTSPADSYYRHQIPYVPRHSGSAVLNVAWRRWSLNYSYIYVGERYNQQENIRYNYMPPWYTSDLSASRDFNVGKVGMKVLVEVNNVFGQDYAVILNYPMPGRNFRVAIMVNLAN